MKILVVDDIKFNAVLVELVLQRAGHVVFKAESGSEALELLTRDMTFDLVVCDLLMPVMDGIEMYKQALEIPHYRKAGISSLPPFILLTASKNVEKMVEAKLLGFADILLKPLDAQRLMESIDRVQTQPQSFTTDLTRTLQSVKDLKEQIRMRKDVDAAKTTLEFLEKTVADLKGFLARSNSD